MRDLPFWLYNLHDSKSAFKTYSRESFARYLGNLISVIALLASERLVKHESASNQREACGSIYQIKRTFAFFFSILFRLNYLLWFGDIGAGHDESAFLF